MDLQLGMDMAYTLESTESAWGTHDTKSSPLFQNDIDKPFIDFRPRVQIKTSIKKFGLLAAYSIGLNNYYYKNNLPAKSNFLRIGFSYQIK